MIAAAPLTDTVKRAREPRPPDGDLSRGAARRSPRRSAAITSGRRRRPRCSGPQALREALDTDPQRIAAATDDAMLVEKAGGKVLIHPAPAENLKVTTALDLRVAELLLAEREVS